MAAPTAPAESWDALLAEGEATDRLVHQALLPARPASVVPLPADLHPDLRTALGKSGVDALYAHQEEALRATFEGPTIVTTGTASGKSLAFNLPTLDVLLSEPRARALYLYPTKALAQDQARALGTLGLAGLRPAIYDGDTPRPERLAIRRKANLVLTNPDMLHVGILPHHEAWGDFFANLAMVVVDEAHVYRGVFGSHVANVLRRLRRVASFYGTAPRFVLASATVANPVELAERLTGLEPFTLVDRDGAPAAERRVAMWNPPILDEALGTRGSPLAEAAELLAELVRAGRADDLLHQVAQGRRAHHPHGRDQREPNLEGLVAPYRAGYTPQQRRELERKLVGGELLAVVATDALELGIDIGSLDAAICVTFPGTVASLRQMWGRAGRRGTGLALYVAGEDALDQFLCRHPEALLDRPVEAAILDHASEEVMHGHVACAAREAPLTAEDDEYLRRSGARTPTRSWPRASCASAASAYGLREADDYPAARIGAALRLARRGHARRRRVRRDHRHARARRARRARSTRARSTCTSGASSRWPSSISSAAAPCSAPFSGDWFTQPKSRHRHRHRAPARPARDDGRAPVLRRGARSPSRSSATSASGSQITTVLDFHVARPAADDVPDHARALVRARRPARRRPAPARAAARRAARARARRRSPSCRCWPCATAGTSAACRPTPIPRRSPRRSSSTTATPAGSGSPGRASRRFEELCGDAQRLIAECPCRAGCPSCVQSPEMREPQRAAVQGRRIASCWPHARGG